MIFYLFLGSVGNVHIWDLARRVTSEEELLNLGRDVLQLPEYVIRSALSENRYANTAVNVLEIWRKNQGTLEKAYRSLYNALLDNGWREIAQELRQSDQEGKHIDAGRVRLIQSLSSARFSFELSEILI